jgi:hypothetical protein
LAAGVLVAALLGGCAAWCGKPHGGGSEGASAEADRPAAPTAPADLKPSKPGESFATAGPALGNRDLQPCCCVNGGHYQFLGADLVDEEHHLVVRTLEDPIYGTVVRVFDDQDSDNATFVLHRRDCKKLDAKLKPTGSWINGINILSLELDLDCTTPAGDAIAGSFKADECG